MLQMFFYFGIGLSVVAHANVYHPDVHLGTIELIGKYGYPVEIHEVTTADGYMLTMFRIPHGRQGSGVNRKPILLMHGIYGQAENFIVSGMNNASLAYFLAENEFDVWLGNSRGTQHGMKHRTLNPNEKEFWNFSYHELGVYDLTAKVDYILKTSEKDKIFYIGHSQGGTIFYVMSSERPEYQQKINVATLLAPAGYMGHFAHPVLLPLVKRHVQFYRLLEDAKFYELPPRIMSLPSLLNEICGNDVFGDVCVTVYHFIFGGRDSGEFNKQMFPLLVKYLPSISTKQLLHFAQDISSGHFRKLDFGVQENLRKYNTNAPPDYHLRNITLPVAVFYSQNDIIVDKRDIEHTCKALPHCVKKFVIANPKWTHLDFLFAINGVKLLHEPLLKFLKKYDKI